MSAQQEQNNGNPTPNSAANPVETDAGANVSSIPTPLPRQRPRKNKWLQSQGQIIGLKRRKGDRNPMNWRFEIDNQWIGHEITKGWDNDLPEKKPKPRPDSGSDKEKGSFWGKFKFWQKKEKEGSGTTESN